jgi:hypothetical protein
MKLSSKVLCRKFHNEWSACTMILLLITTSLVLMCSLEFIGLLNNSRNIDYRLSKPEAAIKSKIHSKRISEGIQLAMSNQVPNQIAVLNSEKLLHTAELNEKEMTNKYYETKMSFIDELLLQAAVTQRVYEKNRSDPKIEIIDGELFFFYV